VVTAAWRFDIGRAAPINGLMKARFITFEGGEGAGKSTQMRRLAERLEAAGRQVVTTREPGGTPLAESIRRVILSGQAAQFGPGGEAMLFAAARADHVDKLIRPALGDGKWVLCDRFIDSTEVYQGATGGVEPGLLRTLERVSVGETRPDLTIILDVPAEVGLARAAARGVGTGVPDRFERDALVLHEARRQAYLDIAAREPGRCVVIDGTGSEDEIADRVWQAVSGRLLEEAA
jgi:dTMP kinase